MLALALILIVTISYAQNPGIGTATPNTSEILDVSSTSKGMNSSQRTAIASPAAGLQSSKAIKILSNK